MKKKHTYFDLIIQASSVVVVIILLIDLYRAV